MTLARDAIRRHIVAVAVACLFVAVAYAVMETSPKKNVGTFVIGMLLLPGTILGFFVGGGMSMVDGLTPAWRIDIAFALGFLLDTALMYGLCLLLAKMVKIVRKY